MMELKPLPLNTLNRRDRHNAEREVLAAALEACKMLDDLESGPHHECTYCGDKHIDESDACPVDLARRALDMAKVKGVL